ncbi:restriction endonuclease subunit S [Comamonas aquatica]|uniref:restriction endonuclease subunit S n=1 Tax=Comamonas aquatica TaxID=225991 RepID=UPI0009DE6BEC|nr:restriction endonuclease subunit S [Comamonas aquatica]
MSSELRLTRLEEVLSFANGRTSPDREDAAPVPVFGSNGLIGKAREFNSQPNTIVIGRVGSYCGSVHFSSEACWVTDNAIRATAKGENDPSFLYYLLKQLNLNNWRSGSGQPLINQTTLNAIETQIPSPIEQRAIAGLVGALDDRITLLRETNATLEAIAQALFKSWFVDFDPVRAKMEGRAPGGMDEATAALFPDGFETSELGEVPRGWRVGTLGSVCSYLNRGLSPKYLEVGGVLVLNQKCIRDFSVDFAKGRRHDPSQRKIDGREVAVGDVLVNSTGVGTLGRVAQVLYLPEPIIVDSHVTVVRAGPDLSWPYLGQFMARKQPEIEAMGEGSTGQTELGRSKLASLSVVVPSMKVLTSFDELVRPLKQRVAVNERKAQTLSTLRDTLLPRLISGQLRLPEALAATEAALGGTLSA